MNAHKRKKLAKIAEMKKRQEQEILVVKEKVEEKKIEEQKPQEEKVEEKKAEEQTIVASEPTPVKKKKVVNEPV